jgi:hypothetical protein
VADRQEGDQRPLSRDGAERSALDGQRLDRHRADIRTERRLWIVKQRPALTTDRELAVVM